MLPQKLNMAKLLPVFVTYYVQRRSGARSMLLPWQHRVNGMHMFGRAISLYACYLCDGTFNFVKFTEAIMPSDRNCC